MAKYFYIPGVAGNYQIATGPCKLRHIVVTGGTSPTLALYDTQDGTATATTQVFSTQTYTTVPNYGGNGVAPGGDGGSGVFFENGLYAVVGGTSPRMTILFD